MRSFVTAALFLMTQIFATLFAQTPAGNALLFDGVDDYVNCGNDASLNINDKLTIEAWVYSSTFGNGRIVSKWGLNSGYDFDVVTSVNAGYDRSLRFSLNQVTRLDFSLAGLEDQWVHLAVTWDGETCRLYVNGNLEATGSFTGTIVDSEYDLYIGRMANLAPSVFDGLIDEVRIWHRARTKSQIQATMYSSLGRVYYATTDSALVGYWRFDDVIKNITPDLTTYANDGTISGAVQEESDAPLPVELASFSAESDGRSVRLQWQTASETDNFGFEVERFTDSNWQPVGFVNGNGTTTEPQRYEFVDHPTAMPGVLKYRLKQVDTDGTFEYSTELTVTAPVPQAFRLEQNYPNPFNPTTTISYSIPSSEFVTIGIYDLMGRKIRTLVNETKTAGNYQINLDASQLSSGIYFYRLKAGGFEALKTMLCLP